MCALEQQEPVQTGPKQTCPGQMGLEQTPQDQINFKEMGSGQMISEKINALRSGFLRIIFKTKIVFFGTEFKNSSYKSRIHLRFRYSITSSFING